MLILCNEAAVDRAADHFAVASGLIMNDASGLIVTVLILLPALTMYAAVSWSLVSSSRYS